eukprot:CAMPEP_0175123430 /NCGR_PEP_ID=MMETSP0087-20121206/2242_1 /TAXON_ID=136419 /ORGANISM="Unknown Unknown, Strain D1" /LENGTH=33 /DNA_ID= /DNA_START= /DNA_END= /DNA_ORIENTATION=
MAQISYIENSATKAMHRCVTGEAKKPLELAVAG